MSGLLLYAEEPGVSFLISIFPCSQVISTWSWMLKPYRSRYSPLNRMTGWVTVRFRLRACKGWTVCREWRHPFVASLEFMCLVFE